eukprot:CAMPEP_0202961322 /NCGR_PEP_ID=MMETSP1396-20130829/5375_1 /ASSEMBLY_ACC=CAM_ASM_000872 /TAXON_ID= /ORGANISM="Pseudokeronopsis sp., Strain Brazil" /LENGTH=195 /DNA_ID=CAMNT_0049681055 /DNA_START=915 /DNA_END=1502 /DNA_ORIENTATION=-
MVFNKLIVNLNKSCSELKLLHITIEILERNSLVCFALRKKEGLQRYLNDSARDGMQVHFVSRAVGVKDCFEVALAVANDNLGNFSEFVLQEDLAEDLALLTPKQAGFYENDGVSNDQSMKLSKGFFPVVVFVLGHVHVLSEFRVVELDLKGAFRVLKGGLRDFIVEAFIHSFYYWRVWIKLLWIFQIFDNFWNCS